MHTYTLELGIARAHVQPQSSVAIARRLDGTRSYPEQAAKAPTSTAAVIGLCVQVQKRGDYKRFNRAILASLTFGFAQ